MCTNCFDAFINKANSGQGADMVWLGDRKTSNTRKAKDVWTRDATVDVMGY